MAAQKVALLICVGLALLATCNAADKPKSKPHHLAVGSRVWGDRLLERTIVVKDYSWFRIVEEEVTFTGDGIANITMVNLVDQAKDGKGATATIINGGPGFKFVTVRFKSQRSQPINFVAEIYGKQ